MSRTDDELGEIVSSFGQKCMLEVATKSGAVVGKLVGEYFDETLTAIEAYCKREIIDELEMVRVAVRGLGDSSTINPQYSRAIREALDEIENRLTTLKEEIKDE